VNLLKDIATADGYDLQMQVCMFGMATLIREFQVRLMPGHDADQHIRRIVLAKVRTQTELPILNRFHSVPPFRNVGVCQPPRWLPET
jgi:hypothetical protein